MKSMQLPKGALVRRWSKIQRTTRDALAIAGKEVRTLLVWVGAEGLEPSTLSLEGRASHSAQSRCRVARVMLGWSEIVSAGGSL